MRIQRLLPLLLAGAAASPLAAQAPRLSVAPFAGYTWTTPVHEHAAAGELPGGGSFRTQERLSLEAVPTVGARVAYGVGGGWSLHAEGAYGETRFEFRDRAEASAPGGNPQLGGAYSESVFRDDARLASVGVGVGRSFRPVRGAPEMEVGVGGGVRRFALDREEVPCRAPSTGYFGPCGPVGRWERRYDVPGVAGSLALRQRLGGRLAAEGSAAYFGGVADTGSFREDLAPEMDRFEAPGSRRVHALRLAAALAVRL